MLGTLPYYRNPSPLLTTGFGGPSAFFSTCFHRGQIVKSTHALMRPHLHCRVFFFFIYPPKARKSTAGHRHWNPCDLCIVRAGCEGECSGPFNHRIASLFLPPPPSSDVICQGLMNCWLCFSGGASLMYYRWTAGPGLRSVCIAYVGSSLESL